MKPSLRQFQLAADSVSRCPGANVGPTVELATPIVCFVTYRCSPDAATKSLMMFERGADESRTLDSLVCESE